MTYSASYFAIALRPVVACLTPCDRGICNGIGTALEPTLVLLALAILMQVAHVRQAEQTRTQLDCAVTKVTMTDKAGHKGSVQVEEHTTFVIDDAAKAVFFSNGRPLRITRFDKYWISANSEDVEYEFNRVDGSLTFAGSTTKDNVTTIVIGSGRCENASTEKT